MKKNNAIYLPKCLKYYLCLFLLANLYFPFIKAQTTGIDQTVTGVVKDEKGNPLQNVSVTEEGTKNGAVSDKDGAFKLKLKNKNTSLVISSSGYSTQTMVVSNRLIYDIVLKSTSTDLNDVVVVGYGTQKKVNNTGAISTIGTKELVQSPVANISNSLVGRLPGLFATQGSGEPGSDGSKIRIRGVGTFTGNTDPLTLVDGIQVDNYNNIDPNEIESLTILKDAASTAVYGIRGANGVILITTKRGKIGPPKISYTFNEGLNSFIKLRHGLNSADYATDYNIGAKADTYVGGNAYNPKYSATDIELYKNGKDPIFHPNNDWSNLLFRKISTQSQHTIQISGGQKKVRYIVTGGYFNQQGLFKDLTYLNPSFDAQSTFQRYNLRSNFNFDITERLKIALDVSTQTEIRNNNGQTATAGGTERVIGDILKAPPLDGPGVVDGKIVNINSLNINPYSSLLYPSAAGGVARTYRNYLNGSLRADFDLGFITKGLSTHGTVAIQTYNQQIILNTKTLISYLAIPINGGPINGGTVNYVPSATDAQFNFSQTGTYNRRITAEFAIDYKRSFGAHSITGLLLYNQQKTSDPTFQYLVAKGVQSFVGRAFYDFKGRYMVEVNMAYNGTENFAPGKRFGTFPAVSAGWVVSNESFFPTKSIITFLKIRGSSGQVGNDQIGGNRFLYTPTSYTTLGGINNYTNLYYFGNIGTTFTGYNGLREGATGNPNVTWERTVKNNIGVEMRFFKDKLKFTGDIFNAKTNNILATPQTISAIAGLIQPATNLGSMENKGYEGDIGYSDFIGKVGYRIGANLSFARNKITFQDEINPTYSYQRRTGQRYLQNFVVPTDGIYNTWEEVNDAKRPVYQTANNKIQPGDLKFRDVNGDGIIDGFDAVPYGYSTIPEKTFGISLAINYKGFDFSVLFQGVANVSLYYQGDQKNPGFQGNSLPYSTPDYLGESWTPDRYAAGLPIKFPRFYSTSPAPSNFVGSSFYLADASYVRLKNAEIGYSVKANLLKRVGISSCRIYANANNLITWDHTYPGVDPENTRSDANSSNTNAAPYPLVRTVNFGLNVNF